MKKSAQITSTDKRTLNIVGDFRSIRYCMPSKSLWSSAMMPPKKCFLFVFHHPVFRALPLLPPFPAAGPHNDRREDCQEEKGSAEIVHNGQIHVSAPDGVL